MSAAAAAAVDATASPPIKKGKKKLIIIIAAVSVLVLGGGGAAAMLLMNKKGHDGDADAEHSEGAAGHGEKTAAAGKPGERPVPVFVPLEPFTVNLADRDAERYAQVGITLEIADAKIGDQIKLYMPAIRNHFLLAIADNTATDLMGREGKGRLAEKLRLEASRALGYTVTDTAAAEKPTEEADEDAPKKKKKKSKEKAEPELPVRGVHFSNFIIQ